MMNLNFSARDPYGAQASFCNHFDQVFIVVSDLMSIASYFDASIAAKL